MRIRRCRCPTLKERIAHTSYRAGQNICWISRCVAATLFFPVVIAYIFVELEREDRQQEKDDGYRRSEPFPRFLDDDLEKKKSKRKARDSEVKQVTVRKAQMESRLMMLPRELRDMIFVEVMGEKIVHLGIFDRRLRGQVCRREPGCFHLGCVSWTLHADPTIQNQLMGLLLACRQTYEETIQYLYALNQFKTRSVDVIAFLPRLLTPSNLHLIKTLDFLWSMGAPPSLAHNVRWSDNPKKMAKANEKDHEYRRNWSRVWQTLSSMQGLKYLRVHISIANRGHYDLWKAEDFEIVKGVTRPAKFELILPDELGSSMKGKISAGNLEVVERARMVMRGPMGPWTHSFLP